MKHIPPPPPTMSTYRPRLVEVQAIDCGDGRHVLLTEPPRYMPTAEFEAAFELVPDRRAVQRRGKKNGKPPKAERRKAPRRGSKAERVASNGHVAEDPKKVEAQRLFEKDGVNLAEISRRLKIPYAGLYYWSKKWKAPSKAAAKATEAKTDSWME